MFLFHDVEELQGSGFPTRDYISQGPFHPGEARRLVLTNGSDVWHFQGKVTQQRMCVFTFSEKILRLKGSSQQNIGRGPNLACHLFL